MSLGPVIAISHTLVNRQTGAHILHASIIIIIIIIIVRQFLTRRNTTKTLQGCYVLLYDPLPAHTAVCPVFAFHQREGPVTNAVQGDLDFVLHLGHSSVTYFQL